MPKKTQFTAGKDCYERWVLKSLSTEYGWIIKISGLDYSELLYQCDTGTRHNADYHQGCNCYSRPTLMWGLNSVSGSDIFFQTPHVVWEFPAFPIRHWVKLFIICQGEDDIIQHAIFRSVTLLTFQCLNWMVAGYHCLLCMCHKSQVHHWAVIGVLFNYLRLTNIQCNICQPIILHMKYGHMTLVIWTELCT